MRQHRRFLASDLSSPFPQSRGTLLDILEAVIAASQVGTPSRPAAANTGHSGFLSPCRRNRRSEVTSWGAARSAARLRTCRRDSQILALDVLDVLANGHVWWGLVSLRIVMPLRRRLGRMVG